MFWVIGFHPLPSCLSVVGYNSQTVLLKDVGRWLKVAGGDKAVVLWDGLRTKKKAAHEVAALGIEFHSGAYSCDGRLPCRPITWPNIIKKVVSANIFIPERKFQSGFANSLDKVRKRVRTDFAQSRTKSLQRVCTDFRRVAQSCAELMAPRQH